MALINRDAALQEAMRIIKKCHKGHGVELLSYKRNRTIAIIRCSESEVCLRENGYIKEEQTVSLSQLPKILKGCINREFPRSRKVRFFKFASPEELERTRQKI